MNKGLWVVDEIVTHMTSFRLATQAEIDAAASEQLRKDAAVGKAIRKWLDKCENNGASVLIRQWVEDCRDGEIRRVCSVDAKSLNRHMFSPDVDNIHAALEAAGLVEK